MSVPFGHRACLPPTHSLDRRGIESGMRSVRRSSVAQCVRRRAFLDAGALHAAGKDGGSDGRLDVEASGAVPGDVQIEFQVSNSAPGAEVRGRPGSGNLVVDWRSPRWPMVWPARFWPQRRCGKD